MWASRGHELLLTFCSLSRVIHSRERQSRFSGSVGGMNKLVKKRICSVFFQIILPETNLSSLRVVLIFGTSQRLFGIKSDEEAGEYKFLLQMKCRKKLSMAVL